ncbi:MAG TPA: hypothetical protein VNW50_12225 [Streptosporangiaceae bacterium]|nr:hypothetical protein [Streptosporangiaceae bacterium]
MPSGHALPFYALASWLLTELLGALMVRSWIASGGVRAARERPARPDAMSLPVLAGHAGLNLAGLVCWICFVLSGATPLAWLALAFMAPAIGLGISTVTIWTPYPGGRRDTNGSAVPGPAESSPAEPREAESGSAEPGSGGSRSARRPARPGVTPEQELRRRLSDDELAAQLVDELLSRNFAQSPARTVNWSLRPLLPLGHGVLAIATFLLAVLAAIATV